MHERLLLGRERNAAVPDEVRSETISGLSMRFITSEGSEFWIAEVYGAIATPMPDAAQLSDEAMLSF